MAMKAEIVANTWFDRWKEGNFQQLPITDDFSHTSPYGTIDGKTAYLQVVIANKDKFLGHEFDIHDAMYSVNKAAIRYAAIKGDFRLEVCEWHYLRDDLIERIVAYYNIEGEISESRKLELPD